MKKAIIGLKALTLMGAGLLTGCTLDQPNNPLIIDNKIVETEGNMSFGAYSTVSLLSTFDNQPQASDNNLFLSNIYLNANSNSNSMLNLNQQDTEIQSDIDTDQLNDYYNMLAPFLSGNENNVINYGEIITDDPDYEFVQEIELALGGDRTQTFTIKYNMGEEILEEDEDIIDEDDEYEDKEIETRFEGILILGEKTYNFTGYSEIEDDEEKFEIKAYIDEQNYVKMELKHEEGEVKYEYEVSENGMVTITEMKVENEEDEFKIKLSIEENGLESEFTLKQELEDGVWITKMEYETPEGEGVIFVNKTINELGEEVIEFTIKPNDDEEYKVEEEIDNDFNDIDEDEEFDEEDEEEEDESEEYGV